MKILEEMKVTTCNKKFLLIVMIAIAVQLSQICVAGIFHKKTAAEQKAVEEQQVNQTVEVAEEKQTDEEEKTAEEIPTVYPVVIDTSNSNKQSFISKLKSLKPQKKNKQNNKTEEEDITNTVEVGDNQPEKKSFWKKFRKSKNKITSEEKKYEKENRLSKIETIIENEEYFNHDTNNDVYLDKYKRKELTTLKDFYKEKEIIENKDGTLNLSVKEDERTIDKLIEEIENVNPNDTFTPSIQITLKECIGIALAKHPDILSARLSTDVYKDRITQSWAAYFPSLSAGIDYSRSHSKTAGITYNSHSSNYVPNLSAGLLLFDFGKTKTRVDIAKTDYEASTFNMESSINEIIYAVKSAYYNLLFAQKQVEVYQSTIDDFELQLKVARKYFEIGKKPQIDVMMAEYNAGNAKLNLVKAINTMEVARVSLANTMGLPEFANFELAENMPKLEYDADLEILLNDAFTIRPDLLSQEKSVEAAYLNIRSALRGYTPDLVANGSVYRGETDSVHQSNFNFGINLSYSGLNFLQNKKEYDIAKKSYEKALADYESSKQKVYLDVKQAFINLNNTKSTVKQAEMNVEQAKAQNYHANGRYNAGYGDAIELKDSENTYLNAQLEFYQALLDYNTEAANIERLVGRPLKFSENEL